MKNFFRPTRLTLVVFGALLVCNISLLLLGLLRSWGSLWYGVLFQLAWLYALFAAMGIEAVGGGGLFAKPSSLGWILIIGGGLVSVMIYYLLASLISDFLTHEKD